MIKTENIGLAPEPEAVRVPGTQKLPLEQLLRVLAERGELSISDIHELLFRDWSRRKVENLVFAAHEHGDVSIHSEPNGFKHGILQSTLFVKARS